MGKWNFKAIRMLVLIAILFANHSDVHAAWSSNPAVNTAVTVANYVQSGQQIIGDGSGGVIIVWQDNRSGGNSSSYDIYAQKIDANGNVKWANNGILICNAIDSQVSPQLVGDGSGGAIIAWQDRRTSDDNIYAQRIDANGSAVWTPSNGIIISSASASAAPQMVSDGNGGVIIGWWDFRDGADYSMYAQRIDANGAVKWAVNGVAVTTASQASGPSYDYPGIASDGSGGAIFSWTDYRDTRPHIYSQRIDVNGTARWTQDGVPICIAPVGQIEPRITSDGSGGAIIAWTDWRNSTPSLEVGDVYAQRISADGNTQWVADGVGICTNSSYQNSPQITSDRSGGAIIAWEDQRSGLTQIYAQKVDTSGIVKWTADGVHLSPLATSPYNEHHQQMVSDGNGGAIIVWDGLYSVNVYDIYAQRVDASGSILWGTNGAEISTRSYVQQYPQITSDGESGAVIVWQNGSLPQWDLYAQKVVSDGSLAMSCSTTLMIGNTPYTTIQDAYNNSQSGDTIMMTSSAFTEVLTMSRGVAVKMKGGYKCDYSSNPLYASLYGTLTISDGTVIIENMIIH